MFVMMTYDVGKKRVAKALKTARRYLRHVQESVFEGELTDSGLASLQDDLASVLDLSYDKVAFYTWPSPRYASCAGMGPCGGWASEERGNFI